MGEFEVNQEADDLEDEASSKTPRGCVDNRTGEGSTRKLTMRAENEEMIHGQLEGVRVDRRRMLGQDRKAPMTTKWVRCEQGNIVKPLHQSQARGETLQDERRRILDCGHAAS